MFSSNRNIDTICQLITELKNYIDLKTDGLQIDIVSKLSKLLSALTIGAIVFMISALALMFISMMIAAVITTALGSAALAYAIIVTCYALLAWTIYSHRKNWIEAPITNFLAHLFIENQLKESPENNKETDKQ